jgi:hypothetical protein
MPRGPDGQRGPCEPHTANLARSHNLAPSHNLVLSHN